MAKVLVAIDGSEHANRAFQRAVSLFAPGTEYLMLSVVPPWTPADALGLGSTAATGTSTHGSASGSMPLAPRPQDLDSVVENLYEYFRRAQAQAQRVAGVTASGMIEEARPNKRKIGRLIVDIAAEQKADAIVLGAEGSSFVGGVLLGSVSQFVVHHAGCPVMVYRHPA